MDTVWPTTPPTEPPAATTSPVGAPPAWAVNAAGPLPPPSPGRHGSPPSPPPPSGPPRPRFSWPGWWTRPHLSAAGWLASVGAAMLLVAAVVVVASRWETITPEIRVAGLVGSLVATFFAAERGRFRLPTTSIALAALAATLTAPTAIAAAATLGFAWPICVAVGGVASLIATEVQSRRWCLATLKAATLVAGGLVAVGVSAQSDVPVLLLGAGGAVVAIALGAQRRAVSLAVATGVAPCLLVVDRGFGSGTIERIGITPQTSSWAAPLSAAIAAMVIAVVAIRRSDVRVAVGSFAVATSGALVWLATTEASTELRFVLPGAAVLLLVLIERLAGDRAVVVGRVAGMMARPLSRGIAVLAAFVPVAAVAGRDVAEWVDGDGLADWAPAALVTALGLAAVACCGRRSVGRSAALWRDLIVNGAAGALLGAAVVIGMPFEWVAVSALGAWLGVSWLTGWESWRVTTLAHATWIAVLAASAAVSAGVEATLIGAAGTIMTVSLLSTPSIRVALVGIPTTVFLTVSALIAVLGDPVTVGMGVAVAAIAAAGFGVLFPSEANLVVLAGSLGLVNVLVMLDAEPVLLSLAVLLFAAQVMTYGGLHDETAVRRLGFAGAAAAMISLWWTTGVNTAALSALDPYGATGVDLAVGVVGLVLIAAGSGVQVMTRSNSWLAYGPGLATTATWLLARQLDPAADWATFTAVVFGVVTVAVGGWRRLGAPLVIGTLTLAGTLVLSAGPRLSQAPTSAWIALGGVTLLVIAGVIERVERPLLPNDEPGMSVVELLAERFK